jgi:hypothetical protein
MSVKKFTVREGFVYYDADGKHHAEGKTLDLPEEIGNATHQLELAAPRSRTKAVVAEEAAAAAEEVVGDGNS